MDFVLKRRIGESVMEHRKSEADVYVFGWLIEEKSDEELLAGLRRIKAEQKTRVMKEDEAMSIAQAAAVPAEF